MSVSRFSPLRRSRSCFSCTQAGFTMVELMVAMTLGLIITAAVLSVFAGSKQSYRVVHASSEIQENARYAMEMLQHYMRQGGLVENSWEPDANQQTIMDNPVDGSSSTDGAAGASDTVTVQYQKNDVDCLGQATSTSTTPDYLARNTFSVNANNQLVCTAGGNSRALVDGVMNMQVLYGIDVDKDRVVDSFVTATNVTNWTQVVSARIGLLMANSKDNVATSAISFNDTTANPLYELFNQDTDNVAEVFGSTNTASDTKLYKTFITTITFRNRVP